MKMSKELKIGLIGAFLIALLVWGINFLKGKDIFSQTDHYYAVYNNIAGLESSGPVFLNGYKIGMVDNIKLSGVNNKKITVQFFIRGDVKVPYNSKVVIYSSDLMGTKAIRLDFTDKRKYYQPGDTLPSVLQKDLTERLYEEVKPIKDKAETLVSSLDSIIQIFNKDTRSSIQNSLTNFDTTSEHLKHSSAELNRLLSSNTKNIDNTLKNLDSISSSLNKNKKHISKTFSNISEITDSLKRSNIKNTLMHLEQTLSSTDSILQKIKRGEGSAGLLINNDSLYHNLNKTTKDLDLLIKDIKENPKRYINVSVFGKKN
jgi:phospholipid/cholesterol/gamma-HCH transport system substrate-binding protein